VTDGDAPARRTAVISGVDALARLLVLREQMDAADGLTTATMVSGYPGSPLGTFDLTLDALGTEADAHRIVHRPGLNEELAVATVWGSQMGTGVPYREVDGVAGAWYGKGPGLDRSGDALKHANAMGSGPNGGVVVFCGDDPSAKSSTLPCESQYTFADACMPVLVPADQQDLLDLGLHAFRMSRWAGCWVGLKVVTAVADGIGTVEIDPGRVVSHAPTDFEVDGAPWQHRTQTTIGPHAVPDQEALIVDRRLQAACGYALHNGLDRVVGAGPGAPLGVVCAGKTYLDVLQAFDDLGIRPDDLAAAGVRVLKLAMTYPLVESTVIDFVRSVEQVVVIEEKRPFVEGALRSILHEAGVTVPVVGKRDRSGATLASSVGELDPAAIAGILTSVAPDLPRVEASRPAISLSLLPIPGRPPGFCSGCPHNRSTVFPDGALVGGGVGCHGIMYFEPRHQGMRALPPTPMGAEGVPWIGLAPFVADKHLIQNLGDGTLSHSGTLAIRASVAAGVNVTFKVLYNAAVAMTGGQDITGGMSVPAMTRALEAEGVRRIVVCADDPKKYGRRRRAGWASDVRVYHRDRLEEVQEELAAVLGVTVIIYDQQCAAEARRLRKRGRQPEPPQRVVINHAVCEGCGDCSAKSNCLSVLPLETELGVKRRVDDLSCNRDYTCLEGDCPSFVTVTPKRSRRGRSPSTRPAASRSAQSRPALPTGSLPDPSVPTIADSYGIYFTGIGGTGVVTANRILAAAAESAGLLIAGIDQTGLSQKAGAVVSHLRLARDHDGLAAAAVGAEGADLYLSGDILQAAAPNHLAKIVPGHTVAVVESTLTPTAAMLQTEMAAPDPADLQRAVVDRVAGGRATFIDTGLIADQVFANHLLANVVLLGAAFQLGGLPLSLADIDAAMARQGRNADHNRAAFTWGRWAVHDPGAVDAILTAAAQGSGADALLGPSERAAAAAKRLLEARSVPSELVPLVERRAAQVVDYQSVGRAERYLDMVDRAISRDDAEHGWKLTRAIAEAWFRLLTYKDEYEVARLHLKVDYDRVARELGIDGPYKVTYHLHPPVLRRLGMRRKLPLARPYRFAFRTLRPMRHLRGTPLDVFGYDRDRRMERNLVDQFARSLGPSLNDPYVDYGALVRFAESVLAIKGYGPIKEAAVASWHETLADFQAQVAAGKAEVQGAGATR
jgi:indolepyruvate ferredoxin oxidoreductase